MNNAVVPRRAGAVVAQVGATHVRVAFKPFGVIVATLAAAGWAFGVGLAAGGDFRRAGTISDFFMLRIDVDHHPMIEIHAR